MNTKLFIISSLVVIFTIRLFGNAMGQSAQQAVNSELDKKSDHVVSDEATYKISIYNPPFRYLLPKEVEETSGLAFFNGTFWTINDSGGRPVVYGLDTLTGKVVQRITVANATNKDWESLAQDKDYLYIGDFGNNSGNRNDLKIYKIAFADFPKTGDGSLIAEQINFEYDDYKGPISKRKENNFDCEAFLAQGDSLYLFSKNWQDQMSRLYVLPKTPGNYKAKKTSSFDTQGLITGADINHTTGEVVLIGYVNKTFVPFIWVLSDYTGNLFFSGIHKRINLVNLSATQTEAIVFTSAEKGVITSEGHALFSQTAFNFNAKHWLKPQSKKTTGDPLFDFKISPISTKKTKVYLEFNADFDNEYKIQIIDNQENIISLKEQPVLRQKDGINRIKLKIGHLNPGAYTIRVFSGARQVDKKLIIK